MILWQFFYLVFGFGLLIYGSHILIDGSVALAKKYNISELIIGLTIVGFGTSAPELSVSIISAIKGTGGITIGNVIGSNIFNIAVVLGIAGIFQPLVIKKQIIKIDLPFLIIISGLLVLFFQNLILSRLEGFIFIILFLIILLLWYKNRRAPLGEEEEIHYLLKSNWKIALTIIIGITGLSFGGEITVKAAIKIARYFKINETIIAITIIALGTSLPEFITSVVALIKKKSDISVGNIIGSNIFNLLLCLGISSIIKPIKFNLMGEKFTVYAFLYFVFILFPFLSIDKKLTRIEAIILFLSYIIYLTILL